MVDQNRVWIKKLTTQARLWLHSVIPACCVHCHCPSIPSVCPDCCTQIVPRPAIHSLPGLDYAMSLFSYTDVVISILKAIKFESDRSLIADLVRPISTQSHPQVDHSIPVPLHPDRERHRGFNQVTCMMAAIGVPISPSLVRIIPTPALFNKSAADRRNVIRGAFQVSGPVGKRVMIWDDILTTGTTLQECAAVLRHAGATWIGAIALSAPPR